MLELSEDLEVDIPLFWDYFAECVCMMVAEASFPLSSLAPLAVKSCELKAPRCVAKVIAHCAKLTSPERASKLWAQSGLSWTELGVDDSNIVEFLETEVHNNTEEGNLHTVQFLLPEMSLVVLTLNSSQALFAHCSSL